MENGGTHWTVLHNKNGKFKYFDSFGFPPPKVVDKLIKPYEYSNEVYQDPDNMLCGYWVIKYILYGMK